MGNFDRVRDLLEEYNKLTEENGAMSEDINHYFKKIADNNKMKNEIRNEKIVADLQSLVAELCSAWNASPEDLVLNVYYNGVQGFNVNELHLSHFLMEGDLFIIDKNNPEHHHFGIGRHAYNRKGGKFSLFAENLSGDLKVDDLFPNGYFKGVENVAISPILQDVLVETSVFQLFANVNRNIVNGVDNLDSLDDEQKAKTWAIFIKACDRYSEKLKTQENPTM